ncbi:MAG: hypothetical protein R3F19_23695 [Verrucomicrobiales bacterium]
MSSESDDPQFYGSCGGSNLAVERALNRICKKFNVTKKQIRIAYEAGPTGFVDYCVSPKPILEEKPSPRGTIT